MVEIIESNLTPNSPIRKNLICTCIIIDHTGDKYSDINDLDKKHKEEGYPMFTHHYLIKKNGYIFRGRPEEYESYIDKKFNFNVIGIMLEGNFDIEYMNIIQLNNLIKLIADISSRHSHIGTNVYIHSEVNRHVTSPGRLFPCIELKNRILKNYVSTSINFLNARNERVYELGSRTLELRIPLMEGNDIYALKLSMTNLGCKFREMNNSYNKETENQVRLMQKKNNLNDTGVADKEFFELLEKLTIKDTIDRNEQYRRYLKLQTPNMKGKDVSLIKTKLMSLNYYEGDKNDIFDEELSRSVIKFQEDMDIEPTGNIGPLTFYTIVRSKDYSFKRVLELTDPIMEGPDIEIIQEMLYKKGYVVDINGFYDVKTHKAVCQYQLDNNFIIDGKVDFELFEQILN